MSTAYQPPSGETRIPPGIRSLASRTGADKIKNDYQSGGIGVWYADGLPDDTAIGQDVASGWTLSMVHKTTRGSTVIHFKPSDRR